jgi:hypothetical protein
LKPAAILLLAMALWLLAASPARAAEGSCERAVGDWVARCAGKSKLEIVPSHCPPGSVVVRLGSGADLKVEIHKSSGRSFRTAGGLGLSPIGEFADWASEPEARRAAFDELTECVGSDPSLPIPGGVDPHPRGASRTSVPWLLLLALAASLALLALRRPRGLAAGVGLAAGAFAFRWFLLPQAFFHQNGQGPLWIAYALRDHHGLSSYGSGHAELFGWVARAGGSEPERALFLAQALLGAAGVVAAWAIARGVGLSALPSLALALAVGVDPLLGRVAQSESYYASIVALALLAAALLGYGARRGKLWRPELALGVLAAGLLIAQAARIHPVGWVPLAFVPAVVLVGPGGVRRRIQLTLAAGLGIGVIVLCASGPAMLAVMRGAVGRAWGSLAGPNLPALFEPFPLGAIVLAIVAGVALRSPRGLLIGLTAALALAAMITLRLVGEPNPPAVTHAYFRLYWPVLILLAAAWLARALRRQPRTAAGLLLGGGMLIAAAEWSAATSLPTDVREALWAIEWRRSLPPGAAVAYVERSELWISVLPLYEGTTPAVGFPIRLGEGDPPDLARLAGPLFYYRSSVCSGEPTRPACARFEQSLGLEAIAVRELPAIPSMSWQRFGSDRVEVALFRRVD